MKDRKVEVDGGWVNTFSDTHRKLYDIGYSVGGYVMDNEAPKYVLYRVNGGKFEPVHEFENKQELDNMVKLLLPPEG